MKNFRDIETLSAYLDDQLNPTDKARIESRLQSDPELASVLSDLRASRNILRRLPARKAPRNFTLTRQMVGLRPPMPRSYPLLRYATLFATFLFMCSFTTNMLTPMFSLGFGGAAAPAFGMGGGCDGPCGDTAMESAAATEEAPLMEAAPAATEEAPAAEPQIIPTATIDDTARLATPEATTKEAGTEVAAQGQAPETADQAPAGEEAPVPFNWTLVFLVIAILGGVVMFFMRQSALRKWR
jgi:hypothetical protein